jgi:glycosyltransferase involved in cell wall biosynthesis
VPERPVEAAAACEVTIVVPTRNRSEPLRRCLEALSGQVGVETIEIIVVDDGSDDPAAVDAALEHAPQARLLRQPRSGPASARNAGVRAARGSIVCFTDDDCEPDPDWAAALAAELRDGADIVAGTTVNGLPGNLYAVAAQLVTDYVTERGRHPFAATNNFAAGDRFLRELPFDEAFRDAGGEDREWCSRVAARGYRISSSQARVVHHHELTCTTYVGQQLRYGRGSYRYHASGPAFERSGFYTGLIGRGFRTCVRVGLLVAAAQLATGVGYVTEWVATQRSRPSLRG